MTATVMTVLGAVPGEDLGVTLPHEHVFIDLMREYRGDGLLNDEALMTREVRVFRDAGGGTIVDVTSVGLGRRPEDLRRMSEATGVRIVMGSGYYREPYVDRDAIDRASVDELAAGIVRDVTEGVDGTDVRAGIIGELGSGAWLTSAEERCFRAAARAHRQTGLTVTTHAAWWPVGLWQLDVLEDEGVDPARIIIGHCDLVPDPGYHLAIARRGAWIQFDCVQGGSEYDTAARVGWIRALVDGGFGDRILLSHDVCLRSNLAEFGGPGYAYVPTTFRQRLIDDGFAPDLVARFLIDNPRRALTGE